VLGEFWFVVIGKVDIEGLLSNANVLKARITDVELFKQLL